VVPTFNGRVPTYKGKERTGGCLLIRGGIEDGLLRKQKGSGREIPPKVKVNRINTGTMYENITADPRTQQVRKTKLKRVN